MEEISARPSDSARLSGQPGRRQTVVRQRDAVLQIFGEEFMAAFRDPSTTELYRNASGEVWHERVGHDKYKLMDMSNTTAMNGIRSCVGAMGLVITEKSPMVDTEFIIDGSRLFALMPPCSESYVFNIRKKAIAVYTLRDYVTQGVLTESQHDTLVQAVTDHRNIVVVGGTGSGKTTFANALIGEITRQFPLERLIIIEDTKEIQCVASDYQQWHTNRMAEPPVDMSALVKASLRAHPQRILVGEVRDGAGLDMLTAWNTGHEGGVVTIHANNAELGLLRLESLVSMHEKCPKMPGAIERLIGESVQMLVHIALADRKRVIKDILEIEGWDKSTGKYIYKGGARLEPQEQKITALRQERELLRQMVMKLRHENAALGGSGNAVIAEELRGLGFEKAV